MVDVEIHILHAQILQAFIEHPFNVLLCGNALLYLLGRTRQKFGSHNNLIALGKIAQSTPYILLTGAALIGDGCIKKVYAQLQSTTNDLSALFLVNGPGMLTLAGVSKSHTSHTNA